MINSFNDFYNNLSSNGLFFFWIVVFLFVFVIFLLIILLLKNRKLSKYLKEINVKEELNDIQEEPSLISNETKEEHKGVFPYYPPNNGAEEGTRKKAVIEVGKTLFRYGRLNGAYFTDQCEDEVDLSLPFKDYYNNLHCFKVVKPFTAEYGKVAPWYKSKGGPNQYMTQDNKTKKGMNVCQLLLNEYIVYDENCKCPETTPAQAIINKRIIRSANEFKSMKNKTNDYDECAELDTIINMENKRKKGKNSFIKKVKNVISAASKRFFIK